jgi:ferredoxin
MEGVLPQVVQAERCNWCLQCEAICPDFAIEVREAGPAGSGTAGSGAAGSDATGSGPAVGGGGA